MPNSFLSKVGLEFQASSGRETTKLRSVNLYLVSRSLAESKLSKIAANNNVSVEDNDDDYDIQEGDNLAHTSGCVYVSPSGPAPSQQVVAT